MVICIRCLSDGGIKMLIEKDAFTILNVSFEPVCIVCSRLRPRRIHR